MHEVRFVSTMQQKAKGEMYIRTIGYLVRDCSTSKRLPCFLLANKAALNQPLYGIACVQKSSCVPSSIMAFLAHQLTRSFSIESNFKDRQRRTRRVMNLT